MFAIFASANAWVALLTLTFLEIVLGIDNIVFISLTANKLPKKIQSKATNLGLLLAMVQLIILLCLVSLLVGLKTPFYTVQTSWISFGVSVQALILFAGGLFLLYKSPTEIHQKVDQPEQEENSFTKKKINSLSSALLQILLIDFIFSIDSILTAVGMTNNNQWNRRISFGCPHTYDFGSYYFYFDYDCFRQ